MKFKIGDKVKILPLAVTVGVELEDVGKVGVITYIFFSACEHSGIAVQMQEVCEARGYTPKWSVGYRMIMLMSAKNEQLLFDFMA